MRKVLLLLTLCLAILWGTAGSAQYPTVFMLRTVPTADIAQVASSHGLKILRSLDSAGNVYLVSSTVAWADLLTELNTDPTIISAELNGQGGLVETPSNGQLNQSTAAILETLPDRTIVVSFGRQVWKGYVFQKAARIIRAPETHEKWATGAGTVAIIDTGIDPDHPAIAGSVVPGYDFINDEPGIPSDLSGLSQSTAAILEGGTGPGELRVALVNQSTAAILEQSTAAILEGTGLPPAFGHGTMVAGLVRLAAPTAQIMPLRVFTNDGVATTSDIVRAIYWAVDHGANVINMSFSLTTSSDELQRALRYAREHAVVCVASAGNEAQATLVFPAGYRHVMGVGSTDDLDIRSAFSNFGSNLVQISAPGEGLITAYPGGGYAAVWGTSFSAALVSGAGSILVQLSPGLDSNAAEDLLTQAKGGKRIGVPLSQDRLDLFVAALRALKPGFQP